MEIGAVEAKNQLAALLDRVEHGEEVIITRDGRAVARLIPHTARIDTPRVQAALDRIRKRAGSVKGPHDRATVKQDRDAGRPQAWSTV